MPPNLQPQVAARAGNRCEYCRMHQSLQGATFHVEHVVPRCAGGSDEFENLAWACPSSNLHKASRTKVDAPGTSAPIPLFNPPTDRWSDHFEWDDYSLTGKTDVGRATIFMLVLNHERRLRIRQAEQRFGRFPPDVLTRTTTEL